MLVDDLGSLVVALVGGTLCVSAAVHHAGEVSAVSSVAGPMLALAIDGGLALVLTYAGWWLHRTSLPKTERWSVGVWTVAGAVSGAAVTGLTFAVKLFEGRSLAEPTFDVLVGAAGGGLVLFVAGYYAASLRAASRRYESVFENTFQFTGLLRPDGTLIEVNEMALSFATEREDEIIGTKIWNTSYFQPDSASRETVKNAVKQARDGEPFRGRITIHTSGRIAKLEFAVTAVTGADGTIEYLIAEGLDITELQQSREHSDIVHRYLRHNLGNELNIIHGYANVLLDGSNDDDRGPAQIIHETAGDIITTLELVKIVSTEIRAEHPHDASVNISRVLGESVDRGEAEIVFPSGDSVEDCQVRATERFIPVLRESLESLSEHVETDEPIHIDTLRRPDTVAIELRCDGWNIPPEELSEFDSPADRTATYHPKNIDLWLIKAMTREYGGHIDYRRASDDGTVLRIVLPVADSVSPAQNPVGSA
jgi:PAS domain S-box